MKWFRKAKSIREHGNRQKAGFVLLIDGEVGSGWKSIKWDENERVRRWKLWFRIKTKCWYLCPKWCNRAGKQSLQGRQEKEKHLIVGGISPHFSYKEGSREQQQWINGGHTEPWSPPEEASPCTAFLKAPCISGHRGKAQEIPENRVNTRCFLFMMKQNSTWIPKRPFYQTIRKTRQLNTHGWKAKNKSKL